MAILPITLYGESVLKQNGNEVHQIDQGIIQLANDMIETAKKSHGIGLAAQQVNRLERVIIVDLSSIDESYQALALINPRVVWASKEKESIEEGCLSFPGLRFNVERPTRVEVTAWNVAGEELTIQAEHLLARVLQHEIDHTNGVLFIDRISPMKRKFVLKNWQNSSGV